jgi:hypothetical protein
VSLGDDEDEDEDDDPSVIYDCIHDITTIRSMIHLLLHVRPPPCALLTRPGPLVVQLQRRSQDMHAALTTIRLLESLIRLSEAHARLMGRDQARKHPPLRLVITRDG